MGQGRHDSLSQAQKRDGARRVAPYAKDYKLIWSSQNHLYAILSGLLCGMSFLTFYLALTSGEVSRVVVLTATYSVVTVLIARTFLAEPFTIKTALKTALPVAGVILLSV